VRSTVWRTDPDFFDVITRVLPDLVALGSKRLAEYKEVRKLVRRAAWNPEKGWSPFDTGTGWPSSTGDLLDGLERLERAMRDTPGTE
jgi:hypothetical protein